MYYWKYCKINFQLHINLSGLEFTKNHNMTTYYVVVSQEFYLRK